MADPIPPRPGLGNIADQIAELRREVARLKTPSGTQRDDVAGTLLTTVGYLAALQSFGSSGLNSTSLTNRVADGVTRYYYIGPGPTSQTPGSGSHFVNGLQVPTNKMMVTASVGEASITPHDGFVIAHVSFGVFDGDGKTVLANGVRSGRLYTNTRIGVGLSTGSVLVTIDPLRFRPPYAVVLYVGYWAQNTGTAATPSFVFNTPALRVEIVGNAT